MMIVEKYWDDVCEGDVCMSLIYVVIKVCIFVYVDFIGDYMFVYVDEDYVNVSYFGCFVVYGLFGLFVVDGLKI